MEMLRNQLSALTLRLFAVFTLGWLVLSGEIYFIGICAAYFPHSHGYYQDIGSVAFYVKDDAILITLWLPALVVGAYLLSLIRPRQWLLYSAIAALPIMFFGLRGIWSGYVYGMTALNLVGARVIPLILNMVLLPALLALMYWNAHRSRLRGDR